MKDTPKYCRHFSCQCERAGELALMSDLTGRDDLLVHALEIHKWDLEVRCVIPQGRASRSGAPNAPLPERR